MEVGISSQKYSFKFNDIASVYLQIELIASFFDKGSVIPGLYFFAILKLNYKRCK